MTLAIMQPYIFPYVGYFQLIAAADKFLLLDDVAFINKGWINRNRILVNGQPSFFNIGVIGASQNKLINTLGLLPEDKWKVRLEKTISMSYSKCIGYHEFFPVFREALYLNTDNLSMYLANSITAICSFLDVRTTIVPSTAIFENIALKGQDRIIDLCKKNHTTTYINASGGRSLYDSASFKKEQIELKFLQPQLIAYAQAGCKEFVPGLSIIDMLMNCPKSFVQDQVKHFILE